MKHSCSRTCVRALQQITRTTLVEALDDFLLGLTASTNNLSVLKQFYEYVKLKFMIPCEIGMLFVEKITAEKLFPMFSLTQQETNSLVNQKIELYQWVSPKHFEIKQVNLYTAVKLIRKIETTNLPSVKIYYLMYGIQKIYERIGKDVCLDGFFPYLVYCLIKSNVKDLLVHVSFASQFRRKFDQECTEGCMHGFQIEVKCECLLSKDWRNQDEYYITTVLAAIDYISKIEFYNLNVSRDEFDLEISKRIAQLKG